MTPSFIRQFMETHPDDADDPVLCNFFLKNVKDQFQLSSFPPETLSSSQRNELLEQAEEMITKMEHSQIANTISYTTLIGIYARKGDKSSAKKAMSFLHKMEGSSHVKPNIQTYNSVLHALVNAGDMQRAEHRLQQMEEIDLVSVVSYTILMNGWRMKNDYSKVESTFEKMKRAATHNTACEPNFHAYVTLIRAYTQANEPEKAQNTLMQMYKSKIPANSQLLTAVIDCWGKSGQRDAGSKAEKLLSWMIEEYRATDDKNLQPNEYTFGAAIAAWSKSRAFGKAQRANDLLCQMRSLAEEGVLDKTPNTHCYTAVMNACAYCVNDTSEKNVSLDIAVKTYKAFLSDTNAEPSPVAFATFITALRNLVPEGTKRASAVATVLQNAADDGCVNELVLRRVQSAARIEDLSNLLPSLVTQQGSVSYAGLPMEWKRNVSGFSDARYLVQP